ncbi:YesL family protein [Virgibacillus sp. FSP13]
MSVLSTNIGSLTNWIVRLACLNTLWVVFCVVGGVLFGWAPATVGLFTILRKWIKKENPPLVSSFFNVYRKEFIKSNVIGIGIVSLMAIFLTNFFILLPQSDPISKIFLLGNGSLFVTLVLFLLFFFPIYVHYKGGYKTIFNKTFLIALAKLPFTIVAFILCLAWGRILLFFPGLVCFFGVSVPALMITIIAQHCFRTNLKTFSRQIEELE